MTDLASLTADKLEDRVRRFCMDGRTVNPKGEDALSELVRRVRVGDETALERDALLDIADAARDALAVLVEYHEDLNVTFLLADKLAVLDTNKEDA